MDSPKVPGSLPIDEAPAEREQVDSAAHDIGTITACLPEKLRSCAIASAMNDFVHAKNRIHILGLPAELRNKIYRLALVHDWIAINTNTRGQPPLLQVCRQVRNEAIKIYYTENLFIFRITNYDGATYIPFHSIVMRYREQDSDTKCGGYDVNSAVPKNLMAWLKAAHERRCWGVIRTKEADGDPAYDPYVGIMCLFSALPAVKTMEWRDVEKVLVEMRPMLVMQDKRWGVDH